MEHIEELDIRFIGQFTEIQFNDYFKWFYENGKIIDKVIITLKQAQIISAWQHMPAKIDRTIKVYSTDFSDIELEIK